ncbi:MULTISPECIES: acyl-CoA dehydrogenase family protein [Nocardia]|uniref:acyl-CoA dehydrogenase family protein n=1 Tax=Nocardia abscessus TaxID=120957 RepID=UPI00189423C9|nr:acyl-CoA dehydrogenase family protein [Nocardia abscessus]MBF6474035.1 acyl-CoA dehydrogenase family protein [Nocardia abscessus]
MDTLLDFLVTEPVATAPLDDVAAAWTRHRVAANRFEQPVEVAIAGGFGADRLGFAFLSGYQEALRTLIPDLPDDELVAMCATEEGGGHPAAIRATLTERDGVWVVNGTKSFVTMGSFARRLVVIASVGTSSDGRNMLRACMIDARAAGVHRTDHPALPFAPEVAHSSVVLTDVPARVLPGDGYLDYLKPFRTIEDIHVLAATSGWLVRVARASDWPRASRQRLLTLVAAVRGLDIDAPSSPGVHIALGGLFELFGDLLTGFEPLWPAADPVTRQRWERDRPLLATAGRVRGQRLAAAWRAVEPSGPVGTGA